ncbi:hypothetical protein CLHUN_29750 [Ruminiclostridium hungatei]|uniref:Uncharacterized protein n=1 Tax=Ruminiclostridium hungatei TaxID=48256 RepID=A0A1V4SHQ9_RUMHU|nr:hypothetical protein [Ruminiclostridium hungatei]OPX43036.1 hypothetical protein CLHUN_29750 [Ruminiclostridium hungatei]
MSVTLSIWSTKQGEIRRFLHSFYQKDFKNEEFSRRWVGNFYNPMDSIDMISALMDNFENYEVTLYIHMENGYLHKITEGNYDDVIKGLIGIYYLPVECDTGLEVS